MKKLFQKLLGKRKPKSGIAPEMRVFLAEALEARVLYSAAPVATPVEDSAPVEDSVPESDRVARLERNWKSRNHIDHDGFPRRTD